MANPCTEAATSGSSDRDNKSSLLLSSSHQSVRASIDSLEMTKRKAQHHKKWNRRLKVLFCCLGYKKNKDSIADVASIFAEFYADLKVPSSDLAAGFVLLSKYQIAQRDWILKNKHFGVEQYVSNVPIKADTSFLDISAAEDSHLINELIYYMNYSLAIFGWPMQIVDDPCMLCCICPYLKLSSCCSGKKSKHHLKVDVKNMVDDKRQSYEATTIQDVRDSTSNSISNGNVEKPTELIENSSDKNAPKSNQDYNGKRANSDSNSFSSNTNINASNSNNSNRDQPGKLSDDRPIILDDNCCSCHSASAERRLAAHNYEIIYVTYRVAINVIPFLVAADHSKRTIVVALRGSMSLSDMVTDMNGQIDKVPIDDCPDDWLCHRGITKAAMYVKTALIEQHILDRAFNSRPDLVSQDYNLILCGHSLGAGAAAILGVLLRKQYPNLKAFLYSPPGGILSIPVVEYTKEFAIGIILGNDTVPRLGVAQLERLRYHTLLSLKSSQKTAGKILFEAICPSCCVGSNELDYDPSQSLDLLYGTGGRSFDYNNTKIPFQVQPQVLYVPGRLIHIVKNYSFKSRSRRFFNEPIYQAVWTDNTSYDRVMVSEGMFMDHLPNHLMHAMKMLFSKTLPGRRESKSSTTVVVDVLNNEMAGTIGTCSGSPSTLRRNILCIEDRKVEVELIQEIVSDEKDVNNNDHVDEIVVKNETDENNNNGFEQSSKRQSRKHDTVLKATGCSPTHKNRDGLGTVENCTEIGKSKNSSSSFDNLDENGNEKSAMTSN